MSRSTRTGFPSLFFRTRNRGSERGRAPVDRLKGRAAGFANIRLPPRGGRRSGHGGGLLDPAKTRSGWGPIEILPNDPGKESARPRIGLRFLGTAPPDPGGPKIHGSVGMRSPRPGFLGVGIGSTARPSCGVEVPLGRRPRPGGEASSTRNPCRPWGRRRDAPLSRFSSK